MMGSDGLSGMRSLRLPFSSNFFVFLLTVFPLSAKFSSPEFVLYSKICFFFIHSYEFLILRRNELPKMMKAQ